MRKTDPPPIASGLSSGLSRRSALLSLAGVAVALLESRNGAQAAGAVLTPEAFGAKGDGVHDDYHALLRLAAAASGTSGASVRFGRRKRYRIDQVRIGGGPQRNGISNILFDRCRRLTIDFNGATVDVKGDFHRGRDFKRGRYAHSHSRGVEAFIFRNCADLVVRNGILNGNADRMTRDPGVVEAGGRGIILAGCHGVLLEDLHIHHFPTDGVGIRPDAKRRVSTDVRLNRVRLTNNGRQGLTNAGGVQVVGTDSVFSENGYTGGPYHHRPGAGVDIEPDRVLDKRSDFRALRCRFDNNRGSPVVAGSPDRSASVELSDCSGRCESQRRMIFTAERTLVRGGTWHNIQIACAFGAHRQFRHGISIEVAGGVWSGDDPKWAPIYDLSKRKPSVHIHSARFELRSRKRFVDAYLFKCANPNHRFENNRIFVSASGHDGNRDDLIGQFAHAVVRDNRWSTDLRSPLRFVNNYKGAAEVDGETFSGSFAAIGAG